MGLSLDPPVPLTAYQMLLVALVSYGHTNAAIAQRLRITESTVKNRLVQVYDALGMDNRVELALWWTKNYAFQDESVEIEERPFQGELL